MTKQTTALNVEPVIAEAWAKAQEARNPIECLRCMQALARRLDEQRDGMNRQQQQCLDQLIYEIRQLDTALLSFSSARIVPCIHEMILAATGIGAAMTSMALAVYVPTLEQVKRIAQGSVNSAKKRGQSVPVKKRNANLARQVQAYMAEGLTYTAATTKAGGELSPPLSGRAVRRVVKKK